MFRAVLSQIPREVTRKVEETTADYVDVTDKNRSGEDSEQKVTKATKTPWFQLATASLCTESQPLMDTNEHQLSGLVSIRLASWLAYFGARAGDPPSPKLRRG